MNGEETEIKGRTDKHTNLASEYARAKDAYLRSKRRKSPATTTTTTTTATEEVKAEAEAVSQGKGNDIGQGRASPMQGTTIAQSSSTHSLLQKMRGLQESKSNAANYMMGSRREALSNTSMNQDGRVNGGGGGGGGTITTDDDDDDDDACGGVGVGFGVGIGVEVEVGEVGNVGDDYRDRGQTMPPSARLITELADKCHCRLGLAKPPTLQNENIDIAGLLRSILERYEEDEEASEFSAYAAAAAADAAAADADAELEELEDQLFLEIRSAGLRKGRETTLVNMVREIRSVRCRRGKCRIGSTNRTSGGRGKEDEEEVEKEEEVRRRRRQQQQQQQQQERQKKRHARRSRTLSASVATATCMIHKVIQSWMDHVDNLAAAAESEMYAMERRSDLKMKNELERRTKEEEEAKMIRKKKEQEREMGRERETKRIREEADNVVRVTLEMEREEMRKDMRQIVETIRADERSNAQRMADEARLAVECEMKKRTEALESELNQFRMEVDMLRKDKLSLTACLERAETKLSDHTRREYERETEIDVKIKEFESNVERAITNEKKERDRANRLEEERVKWKAELDSGREKLAEERREELNRIEERIKRILRGKDDRVKEAEERALRFETKLKAAEGFIQRLEGSFDEVSARVLS